MLQRPSSSSKVNSAISTSTNGGGAGGGGGGGGVAPNGKTIAKSNHPSQLGLGDLNNYSTSENRLSANPNDYHFYNRDSNANQHHPTHYNSNHSSNSNFNFNRLSSNTFYSASQSFNSLNSQGSIPSPQPPSSPGLPTSPPPPPPPPPLTEKDNTMTTTTTTNTNHPSAQRYSTQQLLPHSGTAGVSTTSSSRYSYMNSTGIKGNMNMNGTKDFSMRRMGSSSPRPTMRHVSEDVHETGEEEVLDLPSKGETGTRVKDENENQKERIRNGTGTEDDPYTWERPLDTVSRHSRMWDTTPIIRPAVLENRRSRIEVIDPFGFGVNPDVSPYDSAMRYSSIAIAAEKNLTANGRPGSSMSSSRPMSRATYSNGTLGSISNKTMSQYGGSMHEGGAATAPSSPTPWLVGGGTSAKSNSGMSGAVDPVYDTGRATPWASGQKPRSSSLNEIERSRPGTRASSYSGTNGPVGRSKLSAQINDPYSFNAAPSPSLGAHIPQDEDYLNSALYQRVLKAQKAVEKERLKRAAKSPSPSAALDLPLYMPSAATRANAGGAASIISSSGGSTKSKRSVLRRSLGLGWFKSSSEAALVNIRGEGSSTSSNSGSPNPSTSEGRNLPKAQIPTSKSVPQLPLRNHSFQETFESRTPVSNTPPVVPLLQPQPSPEPFTPAPSTPAAFLQQQVPSSSGASTAKSRSPARSRSPAAPPSVASDQLIKQPLSTLLASQQGTPSRRDVSPAASTGARSIGSAASQERPLPTPPVSASAKDDVVNDQSRQSNLVGEDSMLHHRDDQDISSRPLSEVPIPNSSSSTGLNNEVTTLKRRSREPSSGGGGTRSRSRPASSSSVDQKDPSSHLSRSSTPNTAAAAKERPVSSSSVEGLDRSRPWQEETEERQRGIRNRTPSPLRNGPWPPTATAGPLFHLAKAVKVPLPDSPVRQTFSAVAGHRTPAATPPPIAAPALHSTSANAANFVSVPSNPFHALPGAGQIDYGVIPAQYQMRIPRDESHELLDEISSGQRNVSGATIVPEGAYGKDEIEERGQRPTNLQYHHNRTREPSPAKVLPSPSTKRANDFYAAPRDLESPPLRTSSRVESEEGPERVPHRLSSSQQQQLEQSRFDSRRTDARMSSGDPEPSVPDGILRNVVTNEQRLYPHGQNVRPQDVNHQFEQAQFDRARYMPPLENNSNSSQNYLPMAEQSPPLAQYPLQPPSQPFKIGSDGQNTGSKKGTFATPARKKSLTSFFGRKGGKTLKKEDKKVNRTTTSIPINEPAGNVVSPMRSPPPPLVPSKSPLIQNSFTASIQQQRSRQGSPARGPLLSSGPAELEEGPVGRFQQPLGRSLKSTSSRDQMRIDPRLVSPSRGSSQVQGPNTKKPIKPSKRSEERDPYHPPPPDQRNLYHPPPPDMPESVSMPSMTSSHFSREERSDAKASNRTPKFSTKAKPKKSGGFFGFGGGGGASAPSSPKVPNKTSGSSVLQKSQGVTSSIDNTSQTSSSPSSSRRMKLLGGRGSRQPGNDRNGNNAFSFQGSPGRFTAGTMAPGRTQGFYSEFDDVPGKPAQQWER